MNQDVLTVLIGTLSGFIIAFFAEPVKTYFQNSAKLEDLRIALYKELLINYLSLKNLVSDGYSLSQWRTDFSEFTLRNECYKHALENEISLFYQLNEANKINILQGNFISKIIESYSEVKNLSSDETKLARELTKNLIRNTTLFRNIFLLSINDKSFSRKILASIMPKADFYKLLDVAKEIGEKDFSEPDVIQLTD
jgi:hypothetical protein